MAEQSDRAGGKTASGGDATPSPAPEEDRPARYRDVFASVEFRAVFGASALSWIGDYLGKIAVSALVYQLTGSVFYAAASLAVTFLPWLTGAPLLVSLAERYPYRRVMIIADLARLMLVGVAAIPGLPLPAVPALMFLAAMLTPAFEASRSALLPTILSGDRYVVGLSLNSMSQQTTQILGLVSGGLLAIVDARLALGIDAVTFGLSALLIASFVVARPATARGDGERHLLRETAAGFTVVFGNPVLRSVAIVILAGVAFNIVPEGLSAGWSGELGKGSLGQGLIMAANPLGVVVGGIVVGRLMSPSMRRRLIRPLAILCPLSLIGAVFNPPLPVVLLMAAVAGFAMSLVLPANALFVQALPNAYRARAFGVMQGGLQLAQGGAMIAAGAVARGIGVPRTVAIWATIGLVVMVGLSALWPKPAAVDTAIESARRINDEAQNPPASADSRADHAEESPDRGAELPLDKPRLAEQM